MAIALAVDMPNTLLSIDPVVLTSVTGGAGDNYLQSWDSNMKACAGGSPSSLSGKDWSTCSNWAHAAANGSSAPMPKIGK